MVRCGWCQYAMAGDLIQRSGTIQADDDGTCNDPNADTAYESVILLLKLELKLKIWADQVWRRAKTGQPF